MRILSTIGVCIVLASATCAQAQVVGDHCSPFKTCKECLAETNCGFCSVPVVYHNGSEGAQCAGFTPGKENPFKCVGTYTTDKCPEDVHKYACDQKNMTCVISKYGVSKEDCAKSCIKPHPGPPSKTKLYKCASNDTCVEVPTGTSGAASLDVCHSTCGVKKYMCNSTTATCDESKYGLPKKNCDAICKQPTPIPPELEGTWRGLQISQGYTAGEFKLELDAGKYTFTTPAGKSESGTTSTLGGDLIFTGSNGVQKAIYNLQKSEETVDMTLAVGAVGAIAPADYASAMATDEYVFFKCKTGKKCSFSATLFEDKFNFFKDMVNKRLSSVSEVDISSLKARMLINEAADLKTEVDHCGAKLDCESCVKEDLCGWCSTPVVFHDGSTGPRCAGFDKNGSTHFTCNGIYSTEECIQGYECNTTSYTCDLAAPGQGVSKENCELQCKPAAETYVCNPVNFTCEKSTPGHGTSKDLCEASCQHIKPTNSTPTDVKGSWRGIQINTKYTKGEYDVKFGPANFSWTGPSGFAMSGTTQTTGKGSLNLIVQKGPPALVGKVLIGIYSTVNGPETSFISIAFGAAGGAAPGGFDVAMSATGDSEYVMAKCSGAGCKW
ncbi:hypothetical protein CYMTET_10489 [Cymbomonas tetramitiformis]|uniref:Uncharacterized protein n=1 Tax=Cymbomonas tetramitiformis TaxID=36881 RepID=A0AAE0LEF3_9CHLO|nr:hypothetical protein CYMTET_10489 [Cymbomonas tetramitiformis]